MKHIFTIIILCLLGYNSVTAQTKNLGPKVNSVNHEIRPFATKNKLFFVKESVSVRKNTKSKKYGCPKEIARVSGALPPNCQIL